MCSFDWICRWGAYSTPRLSNCIRGAWEGWRRGIKMRLKERREGARRGEAEGRSRREAEVRQAWIPPSFLLLTYEARIKS